MKKLFTLILSALLSLTSLAYAENLRYFGQPENAYVSQIPYGNNAEAGKTVKSGSAQIYYEVYGKGEPVVILHGGLVGSTAEMGELVDRLSPNYQVIAISTRGHGKSTAGKEIPSYEQKAKDVQAVLNQEKIRQPIRLIGFSDGAYTGYYFAAEYPTAISKLVAIGAGEWKKAWRSFDAPFQALVDMDSAYWQQQQKIRPNPEQTEKWYQNQSAYYNQVEISQPLLARVKAKTLVLAGEAKMMPMRRLIR